MPGEQGDVEFFGCVFGFVVVFFICGFFFFFFKTSIFWSNNDDVSSVSSYPANYSEKHANASQHSW